MKRHSYHHKELTETNVELADANQKLLERVAELKTQLAAARKEIAAHEKHFEYCFANHVVDTEIYRARREGMEDAARIAEGHIGTPAAIVLAIRRAAKAKGKA